MKITLFVLFFIGFIAATALAQYEPKPKSFQLGPVASVGISAMTGSIPDGTTTQIQPAFMFGFLGDLRISGNLETLLTMGYESRSLYLQPKGYSEPNQTISVQCISIQAALKWKSIALGISVSEPLSGYQTMNPDQYILTTESSPDPIAVMYSAPIKTTNLNTIFDIRASVLLPLFKVSDKTINLFAQASYCLNNIVSDQFAVVPNPGSDQIHTFKDSRVSMIQIGLSYFFSALD